MAAVTGDSPAVTGDSPAVFDAVLCVSELAANAIVHSRSGRSADGRFTVRAGITDKGLRVEVEDQGGPWTSQSADDIHGGRGLLIVADLARAWGREGSSEGGWTVWVEMDCP